MCEFHGHHFSSSACLHAGTSLVINPESINELYDLRLTPPR